MSGQSFDPLDRLVSKLSTEVCPSVSGQTGPLLCAPTVEQQLTTYDANGEYGLTSVVENADQSELIDEAYDSNGRLLVQESSSPTSALSTYRSYSYDADSRPSSITNSVGTQTWSYDQEGDVLSTTEPSSMLNAATIQYAYYLNGKRESLTAVPSSAAQFSEAYSYDAQTKLKTQSFAGDSQNFTFQFTRTPAGRLSTVSYPNNSPQSFAYDQFGRVSSITYPATSGNAPVVQNGYTYDAAGEKLGFAYGNPQSAEYDYNLRGEQVGASYTPNASGTCSFHNDQIDASANGVLVASSYYGATLTAGAWDARTGAMVAGGVCLQGGASYAYDVRGELTSRTSSSPGTWTGIHGASCIGTINGVASRGYDVENRTVSYDTSANGVDATEPAECVSVPGIELFESYAWGPNGHPVEVLDSYLDGSQVVAINGLQVSDSLHWDGDSLLFSSISDSGNAATGYKAPTPGIDRVFIGDLAVYYPETSSSASSLNIEPRDETGTILNATSSGTTFDKFCSPSYGATTPPSAVSVCQTRSDGYSIGSNTFQGVRTYDMESQQWTTPDAYSGDVSDPMSQQHYVWNDNNAESYADPSGYVVIAAGISFASLDGQDIAADTDKSDISYHVDDPKNGNYLTLDAAAQGAVKAYGALAPNAEIGCDLYCSSPGHCGFDDAHSSGDPLSVAAVDSPNWNGASEIGFWHRHPSGSADDSADLHGVEAQKIAVFKRHWPVSIYTSIDQKLYRQIYYGPQDTEPGMIPLQSVNN